MGRYLYDGMSRLHGCYAAVPEGSDSYPLRISHRCWHPIAGEFTGSTEGAKKLAIKIDSSNANGLALTSAGLKLALATPSTAGVGGTNGAMSAQDKENLDKLNIALCSDAEIGSWFGYASNSTMVTTTLPAVSDDSIEDE